MDSKSIEQAVTVAAKELCQHHGLELVSLNIARAGKQSSVKVAIDRDGGVSSADCQWLSERLSLELDQLDPIPGRYFLEVSSPGVNRPLLAVKDYKRFTGQRVSITTFRPMNDRRSFTGILMQADDEEFIVETNGNQHTIRYDNVASAKLAPTLDELLGRSPKRTI